MGIKYLQPLSRQSFNTLTKITLNQIKLEFGAEVEPFTLHLPVPELLAGAWMACRETLLAGNGARDAKEVVAAAVSTLNHCPYCIDAHSMMLLGSSGNDFETALLDKHLSPFATWASATRTPDSPLLKTPPFSPEEAPSFIGTALFFHYINRMVTILLGPTPLPFTKGTQKKVALHIAAWFFGRSIRLPKESGRSLELLPDTPLPDDFSWATVSPAIAGAYARFARAAESAGTLALPLEVRTMVQQYIEQWDGCDVGLDSSWMDKYVAHLDESQKSAGRLALLAAVAPYRVDNTLIHDFSSHYPGDDLLVAALAWSSFTAARKIGSWLTKESL